MGESLQQERESPWTLTLTERVPKAFEIPPSDWPEKHFSGQSAKRNSSSVANSTGTFAITQITAACRVSQVCRIIRCNSLNSFKNTIRKKNLEALLEEGCHNCPLCSN